MQMNAEKLDEYGALDHLNCLWYIPPTVKFEWARKEIGGVQDIELAVSGQSKPSKVSHPGGIVFFLKETSEGVDVTPTHWPFVFCSPSFVTLCEQDIIDIRIDNDDAPGLATVWPGVDEILKCPVCRKKAVPDEETVYILVLSQGLMMGSEGQLGAKMLWRFFCLECFDSLGARALYIPDEGFSEADMPKSSMPFLEQGLSAPFGAMGYDVTPGNHVCFPGQQAISAYLRVSQFVRSGFHYCISNDYNRYLTYAMGGKAPGKDKIGAPGMTPSLSSTLNIDKLTSRCGAPGCNKTATHVAAENNTLGEQKTKSLLRCSKCRVAVYCSRECQVAGWKAGHKKECKLLRQQQAATS